MELKIFNIEGKELMTLVKEYQTTGNYEVMFDASDLNSGVYFYSLFALGILISTKKLLILK
ncbi:MAG: T9SS type A sorting domain-containing protein [Ignavibacteria bacterium]